MNRDHHTHIPARTWASTGALLLVMMVSSSGTACASSANEKPQKNDAAAVAATASAPTPASHLLLVKALLRGDAARSTSAAGDLLQAAEQLQRSGAQPMPDSPDLARHWRDEAIAAGAKPRNAPVMRGRALGAAYRRDSIGPLQSSNTSQVFLAGKTAAVTVVPVGEMALQLDIATDGKPAVCVQVVGKPQTTCSWIPSYTQRYQIRVSNRSDDGGDYFLIVN